MNHLKLTYIHILCLLSLVVVPLRDLDASACDSHDKNLFAADQAAVKVHAGHQGMKHESSETMSTMTGMDMDCCDECECDYANCHNPMFLILNSSRIDLLHTNGLNAALPIINDKNIPSHPYRPPIA